MKTIQWKSMPVFVAVVLCVVVSAAVYAQEPRQIEADAQVGLVSGIGTHGSFGGGLGVALTPRVLGYGEVTYIPLGGTSTSVTPLGFQSGASAKAINFNVGARYEFSRTRSMAPYGAFGLGLLHSSSSFSSTFAGTSVSGEASSNDVYFNFGGGLRYFVNDRWGWRPEMMIFAGSNTYVRLGAGVFYYFGR
jgi:hypothetical protein